MFIEKNLKVDKNKKISPTTALPQQRYLLLFNHVTFFHEKHANTTVFFFLNGTVACILFCHLYFRTQNILWPSFWVRIFSQIVGWSHDCEGWGARLGSGGVGTNFSFFYKARWWQEGETWGSSLQSSWVEELYFKNGWNHLLVDQGTNGRR